MAPTIHRVRQRPQLRALALSTALMVVGIVLMLMAHVLTWPLALAFLGGVVLLAGTGLFAASWVVARSMTVEIVLTDDGYEIRGPGSVESGHWADIERVTKGDGTMTLHRKDGSVLHLAVTRSSVADWDVLSADITRRLDADRGYRAYE